MENTNGSDLTNTSTPGSLTYGVLVNASAIHGAPIFMNLVNSAALQVVVGDLGETGGEGVGARGEGEDGMLPSITIRSNPLPRTRAEEMSRQVGLAHSTCSRNFASSPLFWSLVYHSGTSMLFFLPFASAFQ